MSYLLCAGDAEFEFELPAPKIAGDGFEEEAAGIAVAGALNPTAPPLRK